MFQFHRAITTLTLLYVSILMALALACSFWLYFAAGKEVSFVARRQTSSGTVGGVIDLQASNERLLYSLVYFNLFVLGGGTLASYALARRTLRPIRRNYIAQTQFAADASHQLRTPLTALKIELQLAQHKHRLSESEYHEVLASSLEEVDRLSTLTERLLRLTAAPSGSAGQQASILQAIATAKKSLHLRLTARRLAIAVPKNDARVAMHQDDLAEVLSIVMDNAVKHSPAHSVITISFQVGRGRVVIAVQDHGPGIAAEDLPHIFERFYRGKGNSKKGHGLGLAVAKKLVQSAGGDITASSTPGHGTHVAITLSISA